MIIVGDCLEVMAGMDADSIDAIVSDPPYGLSFMGKNWDKGVPGVAFWQAALRVAKPGCHLLAFGGTRTFHRLTVAIEDAGWEIRDCIMWVYGSGFPKSHDVSKAIDREAGAEREVACEIKKSQSYGQGMNVVFGGAPDKSGTMKITAPATEAARRWQGWGTALKPAWEPIIVARKPLDGTVANNVLQHGCGGLNVDGCRVGTESTIRANNDKTNGDGWGMGKYANVNGSTCGRWPANLIHDGSDECTSGMGSAARFFYCAKASPSERNAGLDGMEEKKVESDFRQGGAANSRLDGKYAKMQNHHPTVKPVALMQYLAKLATPPGGTVLDPFCGSGSTGVAAIREGMKFIGIELNPDYAEIAKRRIQAEKDKQPLLKAAE